MKIPTKDLFDIVVVVVVDVDVDVDVDVVDVVVVVVDAVVVVVGTTWISVTFIFAFKTHWLVTVSENKPELEGQQESFI